MADSKTMRRCACGEDSAPQLKRNQVVASMSFPSPSTKSATHSAPCRKKIATSRRSLLRSSWPWTERANPGSESKFNLAPFECTRATPPTCLFRRLYAGLFEVRARVCYARTTEPIFHPVIDEVLKKLCIIDEICIAPVRRGMCLRVTRQRQDAAITVAGPPS
jgi:hypothetical protein